MNRLATLQRRLFYATLTVLLASGVSWALSHYFGAPASLSEPLLMKIHGAAAMVALVLVGGLFPAHVAIGWALRRNRRSGASLLLACALLAVTGWLLYYLGDEAAREVSSYLHLAFGLVLPAALGVHLTARPSCQPASVPSASQPRPCPEELAQCKTLTSKKLAPKP